MQDRAIIRTDHSSSMHSKEVVIRDRPRRNLADIVNQGPLE